MSIGNKIWFHNALLKKHEIACRTEFDILQYELRTFCKFWKGKFITDVWMKQKNVLKYLDWWYILIKTKQNEAEINFKPFN